MGALSRAAARADEDLAPFLAPARRSYVLGGLAAAAARFAMWLLPELQARPPARSRARLSMRRKAGTRQAARDGPSRCGVPAGTPGGGRARTARLMRLMACSDRAADACMNVVELKKWSQGAGKHRLPCVPDGRAGRPGRR